MMTEHGGLILAIDAGGTFFKSGLINAAGEIVEHTRISCPVDSGGQADSGAPRLPYPDSQAARKRPGPGPDDQSGGGGHPRPLRLPGGKKPDASQIPRPVRYSSAPVDSGGGGKLPVRFLHDSTAFLLGEYWKGGLKGRETPRA